MPKMLPCRLVPVASLIGLIVAFSQFPLATVTPSQLSKRPALESQVTAKAPLHRGQPPRQGHRKELPSSDYGPEPPEFSRFGSGESDSEPEGAGVADPIEFSRFDNSTEARAGNHATTFTWYDMATGKVLATRTMPLPRQKIPPKGGPVPNRRAKSGQQRP